MPAQLRVTLVDGSLPDLDDDVNAVLRDVFDDIQTIVQEETNLAAVQMRVASFGDHTGPGGTLPLKRRSSRGMLAMRAETQRLGDHHVLGEAGALDATPDVERYLGVQEEGATLRPAFAEKLAFPPGEAGEPARHDLFGMQLLTAREFMEQSAELGYAFVLFTETAILGRLDGQRDFDLIFVRAEEVRIPARHPVGVREVPTVERIERRLQAL